MNQDQKRDEPLAPKTAPAPQDTLPPGHGNASLNEPPGSDVGGGGTGPVPPAPPVIDELMPDGAVIGDPSFTLDVVGTGFGADSVIVFAGHDEPTTWNEGDGTVSTGVNMDVWLGPDTVQVAVRNGAVLSNELPFVFAEAVEELATDAELGKLTRGDLDDLARDRGVDITDAGNKDDVIQLLRRDEKKRKRKR